MPPVHSTEYLAFERQRERNQGRQTDGLRLLGLRPNRARRMIGSLGTLFVVIGKKLQQVDQQNAHAI